MWNTRQEVNKRGDFDWATLPDTVTSPSPTLRSWRRNINGIQIFWYLDSMNVKRRWFCPSWHLVNWGMSGLRGAFSLTATVSIAYPSLLSAVRCGNSFSLIWMTVSAYVSDILVYMSWQTAFTVSKTSLSSLSKPTRHEVKVMWFNERLHLFGCTHTHLHI